MSTHRELALLAARALVGCLLLAACGTELTGSPSATASRVAPTTTATRASTATPSATPAADAAPPEIAGTWRRNVQGELVLLTLRDNGYRIQRGPASGAGRISVDGDAITFSGSNLCDGAGTYAWAIEDERLKLTEIEEDPCDGRTDVLLLGTFGRVDE